MTSWLSYAYLEVGATPVFFLLQALCDNTSPVGLAFQQPDLRAEIIVEQVQICKCSIALILAFVS